MGIYFSILFIYFFLKSSGFMNFQERNYVTWSNNQQFSQLLKDYGVNNEWVEEFKHVSVNGKVVVGAETKVVEPVFGVNLCFESSDQTFLVIKSNEKFQVNFISDFNCLGESRFFDFIFPWS